MDTKNLKKVYLPFTVFVTGACVLVVEVVATRILSPYYGNTIFTVSSIIGVVLTALSLGYYFGGTLADKYPNETLFYSIILISGFSVIILHFLELILLPLFGYKLSIVSGPLVFSALLFFLPSLLLGMLSPFAVKLQGMNFPRKGIGTISGEIFFWSTFGSIFGSLFTGFVLIPQFGINTIIITVAFTLIVLGLFPLIKIGAYKKQTIIIILFSIVGLVSAHLISQTKHSSILYSHDGMYEKITIFDKEYKGKSIRFFQQDRSTSGAIFLNSDELVQDYTKYYRLYKVFTPDIKQALVIGGGAYSIPKALLKEIPNVTVDISEIEPSLYKLAHDYFGLSYANRLNNYIEDGRRLLHDTNKRYDLIFSDVYYSLFSIPIHFTTQEFFKIAKDRLNKNGILVVSLVGDLSRQDPSFTMSEIKTFRSIFPNSYFFAVDSPNKIGSQNIILVGWNSDKKINLKNPKIIKDNDPIIKSLGRRNIDLSRFEFSRYPLLTDNFSPVEFLISRIIKRGFNKEKFIDGDEMLALINQQLRYGPRYLGTQGHTDIQKFLIADLNALTQETKVQSWQQTRSNGKTYPLTNIIGRFYPENKRRIILATHYDSKKFADKDRYKQNQPVPGANDSASGVAVLLEVAQFLVNSHKQPNIGIDIVFFDGEEGDENITSNYANWKPFGSTYFAEHLVDIYGDKKPLSGIVVDMVCDRNLKIFMEQSSVQNAPQQTKNFWNTARKKHDDVFIDKVSPEIRDDHTPLNKAGIPSLLIIDFDYPPFHTTNDVPNKCSAKSLKSVAESVLDYIYTVI